MSGDLFGSRQLASLPSSSSVLRPPSLLPSLSAPTPRTHKPALEPEGELPEGVVERELRAHVPDTTACYKEAIKRDPTTHGRVVVRFWIARDGSVRKVVDNGSSIHDDEMRACVFRVLYNLHFPKPVGGEVPVDVPFRFEPRTSPPAAP